MRGGERRREERGTQSRSPEHVSSSVWCSKWQLVYWVWVWLWSLFTNFNIVTFTDKYWISRRSISQHILSLQLDNALLSSSTQETFKTLLFPFQTLALALQLVKCSQLTTTTAEGEGHILTESCFYEIPRSLADIVNVKQQGDRCYLLIFVTNLMTIGNDGVTHHVPVSPDHVTRTSNNHSRCHVSPGCQAPAGQLATHTAPRNEHWWPGVSVPAWQHPGLPLHSPYLHISYHSLISQ